MGKRAAAIGDYIEFCVVTFNNDIYIIPKEKYADWLSYLNNDHDGDDYFPPYAKTVRGFFKVTEAWINDIHIGDFYNQ